MPVSTLGWVIQQGKDDESKGLNLGLWYMKGKAN